MSVGAGILAGMSDGEWLTRTPTGWTEPRPPRCPCGSTRHLIGWRACTCGQGPLEVGHRLWICRGCGRVVAVGCGLAPE